MHHKCCCYCPYRGIKSNKKHTEIYGESVIFATFCLYYLPLWYFFRFEFGGPVQSEIGLTSRPIFKEWDIRVGFFFPLKLYNIQFCHLKCVKSGIWIYSK